MENLYNHLESISFRADGKDYDFELESAIHGDNFTGELWNKARAKVDEYMKGHDIHNFETIYGITPPGFFF